jgi:hypothetical protein
LFGPGCVVERMCMPGHDSHLPVAWLSKQTPAIILQWHMQADLLVAERQRMAGQADAWRRQRHVHLVHQRHLCRGPQRGIRPQRQVIAGARGRLVRCNLLVRGTLIRLGACPHNHRFCSTREHCSTSACEVS